MNKSESRFFTDNINLATYIKFDKGVDSSSHRYTEEGRLEIGFDNVTEEQAAMWLHQYWNSPVSKRDVVKQGYMDLMKKNRTRRPTGGF